MKVPWVNDLWIQYITDNVCTYECNSMRQCRFFKFLTSKTGLIRRCFLCLSFSLSLSYSVHLCFPWFHILSPSDMICSMNVIDSKVLLWKSSHIHVYCYKLGAYRIMCFLPLETNHFLQVINNYARKFVIPQDFFHVFLFETRK